MSKNRVGLEGLNDLTVKQVSELPIDQIAMLVEDAAERKTQLDAINKKLDLAKDMRFAATAAEKRKTQKKDTGTVRFDDGDFVIIADLPKKVEWEQGKLGDIAAKLKAEGNDPKDYLKVDLSVGEKAFTNWPKPLQEIFEPARTLGVGKATYKIERKKDNG